MAGGASAAHRYADEVWNGRNMDVCDEIFTSDHVYHDPLLPDLPHGPEGVRRRVGIYLGAVPDARLTEDEWVEVGDRALLRWTWRGTNSGELLGIPPTNKSATTTGMHFFHLRDGRIAETWVQLDAVGFFTQLGLINIGPQG